MNVFHMHERGIRICFTIIIHALKASCVPVLDGLTLQEAADLLKILNTSFSRCTERLYILLIEWDDTSCIFRNIFFPFPNGLLSYKRIFVGSRLQLSSLNKGRFF